jgi:hypothetical protein
MIIGLLPVLSACEKELSEEEARYAISIIEPQVSDMLQGLANDDYSLFSTGFDPFMQRSIPESDFTQFRKELNTVLGGYVSRDVTRAVQADEYYLVDYETRFEKAPSVFLGVAFHKALPNTINHIWIESDGHHWSPEPER